MIRILTKNTIFYRFFFVGILTFPKFAVTRNEKDTFFINLLIYNYEQNRIDRKGC